MLKVENLQVKYGEAVALKGVSIAVEKGEVVAVIGSNGAGKTTLLNAIMGTIPKKGRVFFRNKDITYMSTHEIARLNIAYLPDKRTVFGDLSVLDNLKIAAFNNIKRDKSYNFNQKLNAIFEHFTNLEQKLTMKAGFLSGGEQQMLSIAQALLRQPEFVILDEPTAGLSPKLVRDLFNIIVFMKHNSLTVLIVEQNVNKTIDASDRVYVLKNGRVTDHGMAFEFKDELRLKQAYFGG